MRRVGFHPDARAELRAATAFYERERRGLGREFGREIYAVLERLLDWPRSGSTAESGTRRASLERFPFTLVYQLDDDRLVVVAVMHQRQRPGYWRDRT